MIGHRLYRDKSTLAMWFTYLLLALAGLIASYLAYDPSLFLRQEIGDGQWWRLLTGNFAHLNGRHLLLNLVALAVVTHLASGMRAAVWLSLALLIGLGVGVGLYFFSPRIMWYGGLSGIIHGLIVVIALWRWPEAKVTWTAALLVVAAKLILEQVSWLPVHNPTLGLRVVFDAHLYGAGCGGVLGLLVARFKTAA